jgi:hypothetical protein
MNTKPSPYLPAWALRYFERNRVLFDDPEEMPHRRTAFYRLLCADALDPDMRRMWERAARCIPEPTVCHFVPGPDAFLEHVTDTDMDARDFILALILATDDAAKGEPLRLPVKGKAQPEARLRDPVRVLARKVARLLREWQLVTPFNCTAGMGTTMQKIDPVIEHLVKAYGLELAAPDLGDICRRNGIEYAVDTKQGFVQRRRASDAVRAKVISAAQNLIEIGEPPVLDRLVLLVYVMRELPDMKSEHVDQLDEPWMRSQKSGWPDWLRVAHSRLRHFGDDDFLRHRDWAALVHALHGESVSEERIGQVLRSSE